MSRLAMTLGLTALLASCGGRSGKNDGGANPSPTPSPTPGDGDGTGKAQTCDATAHMVLPEGHRLNMSLGGLGGWEIDAQGMAFNNLGEGAVPNKVMAAGSDAKPVDLVSIMGQLQAVRMDATHVYHVVHEGFSEAALYRVPRAGGARETLYAPDRKKHDTLGALAVTTDAVFLVEKASPVNRILRFPKAGGAPTTVYERANVSLLELGVDGDQLYWAVDESLSSGEEMPMEIWTMPLAGGEAKKIATLNERHGVNRLFVKDGTVLYHHIDIFPLESRLFRIPAGATAEVEVTSEGVSIPALDGGTAYFEDRQGLQSVDLASGQVTAKGKGGSGYLTGIAVGPDGLYYAVGRCIHKTAK